MAMNLVRFDWAIKNLLRDKANFDVLEGFLSVILQDNITIQQILSSQGNKQSDSDKYNDVDILVQNTKGEFIIIEIQNTIEHDYFHRILYGTAKVISEYIKSGKPYSEVKKVISITIAYFDLGQGPDYVYRGTNNFVGIHKNDILSLSDKQKELYDRQHVYEIYPEYWIIKAEIFNEEEVNDELDEWVYFLKTGEVKSTFKAPGLRAAKRKLNKLKLKPKVRQEYEAFLERLRRLASYQQNEFIEMNYKIKEAEQKAMLEGKIQGELIGKLEGKLEAKSEVVIELWLDETPISKIAKYTKLSEVDVQQIIENYQNKA